MIDHPLNRRYSQVVNVLIFIFPIVINSLQVAGDIVLFILAMMGIYVGISQKLSPFHIKEIKVFSYLTIGYFTAVCLSVIFSGQATELAHYIPRDFYFLFAPFIALAAYKAEININYLIIGTKVALLLLGVVVIYQYSEGLTHRPSGVMNPNIFGNLSVLLFFIALAFSKDESNTHKMFTAFSLLSGSIIILISGSRGAWLSFFLLLGVYLYFFYKRKNKLSIKTKIIILLITASFFSVVSLSQSGRLIEFVKERASATLTESSAWFMGNRSPTGVGQRLYMFEAALNNIEDVPFFGHGYRTSNVVLFQNDSSIMGENLAGYNHLHNGYLTSYFNGGIVLLGALLLILFVPLKVFIKANKYNRDDPVFISGILLTLGYASFGLVNILLGDTYMNGFYVFFLALFLLLTNKNIKASEL